jgi:hypothetical protein
MSLTVRSLEFGTAYLKQHSNLGVVTQRLEELDPGRLVQLRSR